MTQLVQFQKQLAAFKPQNMVEQANVDLFWEFIDTAPGNLFSRDNYEIGHFTASAFIINAAQTKCVLLHHRKLNKWIQPGGHIEGSWTPITTAIQETLEETGLVVKPVDESIFTVNVYIYPEMSKNQPEHYHYDSTYLMIADDTAPLVQNSESKAVAWLTLAEAHKQGDSMVQWMVEKLQTRQK